MRLDRTSGRLWDDAGQKMFDPVRRRWRGAPVAVGPAGEVVTAVEAARWLQRDSGVPCRAPIGVVGPRSPTDRQSRTSYDVGHVLGQMGLTVLCGGRGGVMEAVCRGAVEGGGTTIGILPDDDWTAANPFVTHPVATGIGVARNAIVARAALCLVAVGGGYGTISEIALALQFGRPVFALAQAPAIEGVRVLPDEHAANAAADAVARVVLGLTPGSDADDALT